LTGLKDYPRPSEDFIEIKGSLESSLTYKIKVEYVAKSDSKNCKNYNFMAGIYVSQSYDFEYRPTIVGNHHSVKIPLKALDPNTECNWKPSTVYLCVNSVENEPTSCGSLFFLRGQHAGNEEIYIECGESKNCFRKPFESHTEDINIFNRTYKVNISEKKT
jgi:hypothetical protein